MHCVVLEQKSSFKYILKNHKIYWLRHYILSHIFNKYAFFFLKKRQL